MLRLQRLQPTFFHRQKLVGNCVGNYSWLLRGWDVPALFLAFNSSNNLSVGSDVQPTSDNGWLREDSLQRMVMQLDSVEAKEMQGDSLQGMVMQPDLLRERETEVDSLPKKEKAQALQELSG